MISLLWRPLILGRAALIILNTLIIWKDDSIMVEVVKENLVFRFSMTTKMPFMEQACRMEVIKSELASFARRIDAKDPLKEVLCDDGASLSKEAMFYKEELDGV